MLSRRDLFLLAGAAWGCSGEDANVAGLTGALAPWHMWGTSQVVTAPVTNLGVNRFQQMARINYARPDSWKFLFAAKLLDSPAPAVNIIVAVHFDLIIGVGRSNVYVKQDEIGLNGGDGFCNFVWDYATFPPTNRLKWTTRVQAPALDDDAATPYTPDVDSFPAQDIQCGVRVFAAGEGVEGDVKLEVHSYFAPRTHIRPEWFSDSHGDSSRYRGDEQGGK